MLKESVRNWIMQVAIDKVAHGKDPAEDTFETQEQRDCYQRTVEQLEDYKKQVTPEQFANTTFDVGYSYDDDDDDDDPWGSL